MSDKKDHLDWLVSMAEATGCFCKSPEDGPCLTCAVQLVKEPLDALRTENKAWRDMGIAKAQLVNVEHEKQLADLKARFKVPDELVELSRKATDTEWLTAVEPSKHIVIGCGHFSEKANQPRGICFIPNGGDNDMEPEREQERIANAELICGLVNWFRKAIADQSDDNKQRSE